MIKVSDYIARYFFDKGVRKAFMVTGGGAMHLNDSIARVVPYDVFFHHHEQACAIAAEGLYRSCGEIGLVNVTTGPGGLNTMTGLMGQWTDSVPAVYVSGQVKFETTVASCPELGLRQLGDQEVDIVPIVRNLVKYAVSLMDPLSVRTELDKAWHAATTGRKGPVWIDVPMNVQGAMVDEGALRGWDCQAAAARDVAVPYTDVVAALRDAQRPAIVAGHGIRLAGVIREAKELLSLVGAPVLSTFNGFDLIASDDPLYAGRIGTLGSRGGNLTLQNADLVLILGSRNNIRQVSYNWENFAHRARRIVVDIDPAELAKPLVKPSLAILADLADFIPGLLAAVRSSSWAGRHSEWLAWAKARCARYPVVEPRRFEGDGLIDPYAFVDTFTRRLEPGELVVAGNGTACVVLFQAGFVKDGQRMFWNSGCASMGYDLPAAIGAARSGKKRVWCLAGDGSIQMNLQELAVIAFHCLPVKVVYLDNQGYASIRQMQSNFFGLEYGCSTRSGLGFPSVEKLAAAYGIPYYRSESLLGVEGTMKKVVDANGPAIWEVKLITDYSFEPKVTSARLPNGQMMAKPLEDMYPFLTPAELAENMLP